MRYNSFVALSASCAQFGGTVMPNYVGLWPKPSDKPEDNKRKRKTAGDLEALRQAIAEHFAKQRKPDVDASRCVRIATWNLRDFGKEHRGERLDEAITFIAEIISHFDVVALQEVYRDLRAFDRLLKKLGRGWDFIMTDATTSSRGNDERMVFVFNRNRVYSRNLAGEISLADNQRIMLPNSFDYAPEGGPLVHLPAGTSIAQPAPDDVHYETGPTTRSSPGKSS